MSKKNIIEKYEQHFVEPEDSPLKLNVKYFSSAALNPFVEHNSSPRGLMMSSHLSQIIVPLNPEVNTIQTGLEHEFGKYVISKMVEVPAEVKAVITRYKTLKVDAPVEYYIIYKNLETGEIDYINIPMFNRYHPYFGFKYELNPKVNYLKPGDILNPGEILAKPPTLKDNGDYGFGVNANVAFMTIPAVDEDGFVVSESFCKKFNYQIFETYSLDVSKDSLLLNIYGDENNYKPFPEIGEKINEKGVIAVVRELESKDYDTFLTPVLIDRESVREFNPIFDKALYARKPGGTVVDIKVYRNAKKKRELPTGTFQLLENYKDALLAFYNQIYSVYKRLKREAESIGNELPLSNKFNTLIVETIGMIESDKENSRLKKTFKKTELELYRIEFTVMYDMGIGVKNKLSNFHGNKGTIVQVWKDDDMPVDKDGNRADIIIDPRSINNRLNIGLLYERYTKASMLKLERIVRDIVKTDKDLEDANKLLEAMNVVVEFLSYIENEQYEAYRQVLENKDFENIRTIIEEIVKDHFYLFLRLDTKKRKWKIVYDLMNSRFKPTYDKVTFKYDGRTKISKRPIMIAPIYTVLLNKIGDSGLTCASAKTNYFGIPIVMSKHDKHRLPYRRNPVRALGESETRIIVAYGGRYLLAELRDRATSLETHAEVYRNLILNEKPTNVDMLVDRNKIQYGKDRPTTIFNSVTKTIGFELEYVKDEREHIAYDPSKILEEKITAATDIEDVTENDD